MIDSPTELQTTELRTTQLRTTQLRKTQLQTTELRKTQLRKGLNFEKDLTLKDPTSNESTSKRTQLRKGPNFDIELRKIIYSGFYMECRQNAKTTKPILLDSLYKAVFTYMD
jgi:hypothetical protein